MNGDFARVTFRREQHFSRVLQYQGRPCLEADLNEQSAIHHYYLRTVIRDLVGRCWRPGDPADQFTIARSGQDYSISKGHLYIDGILCENEVDCSYLHQPYLKERIPTIPGDGAFFFFVECWERNVCAAQFPDLREVALGGPDTSSRAQIVWRLLAADPAWINAQFELVNTALGLMGDTANQAKLKADHDDLIGKLAQASTARGRTAAQAATADICPSAQRFLDDLDLARPRLTVAAQIDNPDPDPCAIAPDAQYRGRENQLYRVEVHRGGVAGAATAGGATFKWSRENGSVVFPIVSMQTAGEMITLSLDGLGHDRRTGLCVGDVVELCSDSVELAPGDPPPLCRVRSIVDSARHIVELDAFGSIDAHPTVLRRWDQVVGIDDAGTIPIEADPDTWTPIERGIKIRFSKGGVCRAGDYWLIVARVNGGSCLWEKVGGTPVAKLNDGIDRHRAVIAIVGGSTTDPVACGCVPKIC